MGMGRSTRSRSSSRIYITVVGGSRADERALRLAEEVGRLVAQRGGVLVTGGMGGVMEAACRGAKGAGGLTVGILPGETRDEANPYVDVALPTGMGNARNALTVLAGDAVIVIGGEAGTLSEVGLALAYGKPVVALRPSGGVAELLAGRRIGSYAVGGADTPEEAVSKAFELAARARETLSQGGGGSPRVPPLPRRPTREEAEEGAREA